jgi:ABC-type transporter Mla maintaining outer membrane lipid asymmetry permease subunit MlaE
MPLILLLAIIVCSIWTTPIDFLYCPAIIALIIVAPIPHFIYRFFAYAGKYSMSMWMCHGYFYMFFPNYLYSLKYPLLIYAALVVISIIVANVIQHISDKLYNKALYFVGN